MSGIDLRLVILRLFFSLRLNIFMHDAKGYFCFQKKCNMNILIRNINELVHVETEPKLRFSGKEMSSIAVLNDAYLFIEDGIIADFGIMDDLAESKMIRKDAMYRFIDATGKSVFPSYCDSHTHLVYPASRELEFVAKINGLSYEEIARRGGGILNSARKMRQATEDELFESAMERLKEIIQLGTGAVEIKSGYGLDTENELKMLKVIKRLKEASPLTIKATFLGAHAVPAQFKANPDEYVDLIINEMIPLVASEDLADYIDVFCDRGFFTVDDTDRILNAGMKYGLRPKIHANELANSGGIQVGVKYNALSVDHLEYTGDEEIEVLRGTDTMPTILPGAAFFLNMPLAPARKMIDAGLPVAMASDFNPGSSPSGNMQLILAMASILYRLTPEEGILATTTNTAYAMGLSDELGSIAIGKKANLFVTKPIPGYQFMPYYYGHNKVETVILNGEIQE